MLGILPDEDESSRRDSQAAPTVATTLSWRCHTASVGERRSCSGRVRVRTRCRRRQSPSEVDGDNPLEVRGARRDVVADVLDKCLAVHRESRELVAETSQRSGERTVVRRHRRLAVVARGNECLIGECCEPVSQRAMEVAGEVTSAVRSGFEVWAGDAVEEDAVAG